MKKLILFLSFFQLFSCTEDLSDTTNCVTFHQDLLAERKDCVREEISPFLAGTYAESTPSDQIGHKENFENLLNFLNKRYDDLLFSVSCYACIETYPAQTEIIVTFPNGDRKAIDISTPKDGELEFLNVH